MENNIQINRSEYENNSNEIAHMSMESIGSVDFFKCNKCPYMALTAKDIQFHWQTSHTKNPSKISDSKSITVKCPGCSGIFYSEISLKTHLRSHHKMFAKDINKLVSSLIQQFKKNQEYIENMDVIIDGYEDANQDSPLVIEVPPDPKHVVIVNNNTPPINVLNIGGSTANFMINSKNQFDNSNTFFINTNAQNLFPKCADLVNATKQFTKISSNAVVGDIQNKNSTKIYDDVRSNSTSILYNKLKNNVGSIQKAQSPKINTEVLSTPSYTMKNIHGDACVKSNVIATREYVTENSNHCLKNISQSAIGSKNSFVLVVNNTQSAYYYNMPSHNQDIDKSQAATISGKVQLLNNHTTMDVKAEKNTRQTNRSKEIKLNKNACGIVNCKMIFLSTANLEYHKSCHLNKTEKLYCPECKSCNFSKVSALHNHLWKIHKIDVELNTCEICQYKTFNKNDLTYHVRIHSNERKYVCKMCSKGFKNSKQLATHKIVHTASVRCDVCMLELKNSTQLLSHKKSVHEKQKKFQCDYCRYSCATKDTMTMHIVRHSGNKFLRCPHCSFKTGDRNALRRHKQRHTSDKSYGCKYCPYKCIQAASLKSHLKSKHGNKKDDRLLTCMLCPFTTFDSKKLQNHLTAHKNGSYKISDNKTISIPPVSKEESVNKISDSKKDIIIEVTDQNSTSMSEANSTNNSATTVLNGKTIENAVDNNVDNGTIQVLQKDNLNSFSNIISCLNPTAANETYNTNIHNELFDVNNKSDPWSSRNRNTSTYNADLENNLNSFDMNGNGTVCNSMFNNHPSNYFSSNIDTDDNDTYFPNCDSNLVINEEIPSSDNTANYNLSGADNATDGFVGNSNNLHPAPNIYENKTNGKPVENIKVNSNIFVKDIVDLAASHIRTIPPNIYASDIQKKPSHTPIILINPKTQTNNRILGANIFSGNSTNSSQMLHLPLQSTNNSMVNNLTQRKKPKISVKSNLILKGPDRLDNFDLQQHRQCDGESNINEYNSNNTPFPPDNYNLPLDFISNTQDANNTSIECPTNDMYNSEHSNFLSNYLINTDYPLSNIQKPMLSNSNTPIIHNNIQTIPLGTNLTDISDVKIENKPYLSNQNLMTNLINGSVHNSSNMFYSVNVPIKFENKMDTLATFVNQNDEIFNDKLERSNLNNSSTVEESSQNFENINNGYNNQSLYPFEDNYYFENDFITETLDGQEIIVLDDTWSDVKSLTSKNSGSHQYNHNIQIPRNINPISKESPRKASGLNVAEDNSHNLSNSGNVKGIELPFDASYSKNVFNDTEFPADQQDVIFDLEEHYEN